jgi:hypothetical protein
MQFHEQHCRMRYLNIKPGGPGPAPAEKMSTNWQGRGISEVTARDKRSGVVDPPGRAGGSLKAWSTTLLTVGHLFQWKKMWKEHVAFPAVVAGGISGGRRGRA